MKKIVLSIEGMTCSACSNGLEKYLKKQKGIEEVAVNLVLNNASIVYDEKQLKIQDLEKYVEKAGFKSLGIDTFEKQERKEARKKYELIAISILSILLLYFSMAHMIGLPQIPFFDHMQYPFRYALLLFFLTLFVLFLGRNILKNGMKNLIHRMPNMDSLVAIGVLASFLYSVYGTIMIAKGKKGYVENLYYESSAIVIFFIKIGKFIENNNKNKTKQALQKLVTITPKTAVILQEGQGVSVTLDEIQKGDIVLCRPGEKIAVDGTIIKGSTHVDESFITGESVPVKKEIGSKVIAGSINYEGTIQFRAEKIGKESVVSEIVRLVSEATNTKPPIAKIADTISGYFVPTILVLAIISFFVWYLFTKDFAFSINRFVSILVIACPCSLGLATPLAIVISQGRCSQKGILVKSSECLENAHKIKTICFDKTGTLTKGALNISKIISYGEKEQSILKQVASIEKNSQHPIANAIVSTAKAKKMELQSITNFQEIPGYGVTANIQKDQYAIGNKNFMLEQGICLTNEADEKQLTEAGNSIVFVSKNGTLVALIGVKDTLREHVKETIQKLKNQKIDVVMLTGDNEKTANFIANEIGIEHVIANVKPKQKAETIKQLKQKGLVMMCGDGINDSISLITADIGVSISNGTDIAINSAQVIFMDDNLAKVNDLISISRKTVRNIKQNLFWAFFYNLCMIPIAMGIFYHFGILVTPMMAAFAMTLSSLTVVLNALRLRKLT